MRTPSFLSDHLRKLLLSKKIATLPELKQALVTTVETLVNSASQGYFANELQQLLHVEVKDALLQLVEQERIARQQVTGLFLYCSPDATVRRRQLLARQARSEDR